MGFLVGNYDNLTVYKEMQGKNISFDSLKTVC